MGRLAKEMIILAVAGLALIYLINPTLGVFEFIPDNLPIVGNLDEVAATTILLGAMRYYGIDPTRLFGGGDRKEKELPPSQDVQRR